MKVCVQGLWHLGSVTAACTASVGHQVIGLDFDTNTIAKLQSGKAPLFEPGLDDLLQAGITSGHLSFTSSVADIAPDTELLWVTCDTPVDEDDNADVEFVLDQIKKVLPNLPEGATVLVSSQMPVGSMGKLEAFAKASLPQKQLGFAYSPEKFYASGKALEVFLKPDRGIIGVRNAQDRARLERLFQPITGNLEFMSVESAEMTKHAINAFLATSVTFANEIAAICELVGADAKEVERGLKTESRIGPKAYLSPGGAFAGGTLARDITYLNVAASGNQLRTPLLSAVKPSNDEHKNWARRKLLEHFGSLKGKHIAVWGLTYKPGTNTLRRSMAVELCNWLLTEGAELTVHDPAVEQLPTEWKSRVTRAESPLATVKGAEALVIATEWPDYKNVSVADVKAAAPALLVIDANRFLAAFASAQNMIYRAVGTKPSSQGNQ